MKSYFMRQNSKKHTIIIRFSLGLLSLLFVVSCESMIFYPADVFVDPVYAGYHPEEVFIKTDDGEILYGWYFKASDRTPTKKNVIVQFHGNAMNMTTHFHSLLWLTDYGYDLLSFDYRGYGLSSGQPSLEGLNRDGLAVLQYASRRFSREGKKLIIYGQSLGGAVAMKVAGENGSSFPITAVVSDGSFASYKSVAYRSFSGLLFPLRLIAYLGLDDRYSPESVIGNISPVPLIVVHSDDDQVVDYSNGQQVYDLARPPRVFFHVSNGGHVNWMQGGQTPASLKFLDLLDRIAGYEQHEDN